MILQKYSERKERGVENLEGGENKIMDWSLRGDESKCKPEYVKRYLSLMC